MRNIRNRSYLQTNQFAVDEQLRGFVEKFSVVGRDALSDALRQRLDILPEHSTRWTPEILHLLLELSDQPVKKTKLSTLERLRATDEDPGVNLRWEDIAKEDGWAQERGLWKNVDFADSSDDEVLPDAHSHTSDSVETVDSSVILPGQRTAKNLTLSDCQDEASLQTVRNSQKWRYDAQPKDAAGRLMKIPISELQVSREVLFLLNGLPTSLFGLDCTPIPKYQMSNIAWDTHRALINSFAEYGRVLLPLRSFCLTKHEVHLVQAFQDSVCRCLRAFDKQIALIQQHFVDIKEDTVVSLIALEEEIRPHITPIGALSNVVRQLQEERFAHTFRFLELLYDGTCLAQLSGDERTYAYLGEIFFDCFRVYIRPIRQWMEGGELTPGDLTFFVAEASSSVPLSHLWSGKFKLRRSEEGQLHAPRFLQPAVRKIFNTGKSIVVLKHLGRFQCPRDHPDSALPEPVLDFRTVCGAAGVSFAPFAELFEGAFDCWVQSKYLSASSNLQAILFESCGLGSSLDALQLVYLMSDGSLAEAFTSSIFASLDDRSTTWTDRFTLTELAQEAWSPCTSFEDYRLSVSVTPDQVFRDKPQMARRSVRNSLPGIRLSYNLAWPVRLVLTKEAIAGYQSTFTLLLQLRRAASILTVSTALLKSQQDSLGTEEQAAYHGLRARLLWFANTFQSYLTTLVLVPEVARMRVDILNAEDLDDMIDIHAAFVKRMVEEACLGPKLAPIRECMLDVLDLTIRLEDARHDEIERARWRAEARTRNQATTPQLFSTPKRQQCTPVAGAGAGPPSTVLRGLYISPKEKEREEDNNTMMLFGRRDNRNKHSDKFWEEENDDDDGDSNSSAVQGEEEEGAKIAGVLLPGDKKGKRKKRHQQQTYADTVSGIRADFDRHLRFIAGGLRGVARASADEAATKWDILAEMLEMGIRER